jgi:two-component system LytT family response regulator
MTTPHADWRVLVADDEPAARRGVRQLLAPFSEFRVVGECRNGLDLLSALEALQPDLVFLDIQMPGIDGFEAIRRRPPERMPTVVFFTAFEQHALRAFEAHAFDYLVKPVTAARFATTITSPAFRVRQCRARRWPPVAD